jgi:hypothetical protein
MRHDRQPGLLGHLEGHVEQGYPRSAADGALGFGSLIVEDACPLGIERGACTPPAGRGPVSVDVLPAVDRDLGPGDIRSVVAAQKKDRARNVGRHPEPIERDAR